MVGVGEIRDHHDEASRRFLHRRLGHRPIRIGRKDLDIRAERVLYHEAVKRIVFFIADLDPETLLAPGELIARRGDHLQGPLTDQTHFIAFISKR
jgi:hypothetical protein